MAGSNVPRRSAAILHWLLDSPDIANLVADLEATRWTGRPGYPIRTMVGMALAKSVYSLPTWTRTVALVSDHRALRRAIGCPRREDVPSIDACYRFTRKLREFKPLLDACIASVLRSLQDELPEFGKDIAIDGSDLPAYANGQRFLYNNGPERTAWSDPDATWGHRSAVSTRKGGGFYGYKVHAAVCATTELPVAWVVESAHVAEALVAMPVLDQAVARGFLPQTAIMDKGYDVGPIYDGCEARGVRPVIPLRQTGKVVAGEHRAPECEHGTWTFAGSDAKRGAAKYRCPTGECCPASTWVKADRLHTLIPRETDRWRKLYRRRACVERGFGRLKNEWALLPLRVRGLERVRLHADLTILTTLAVALAKARAVPLAA